MTTVGVKQLKRLVKVYKISRYKLASFTESFKIIAVIRNALCLGKNTPETFWRPGSAWTSRELTELPCS